MPVWLLLFHTSTQSTTELLVRFFTGAIFIQPVSLYCRHLDFSGCLLRKTGTNGEPPSRYDLIAVSNHYGGLRDGHCEILILYVILCHMPSFCSTHFSALSTDTSYARNKDNGQWYYFDDNKVTYAREEQIVVSLAKWQLRIIYTFFCCLAMSWSPLFCLYPPLLDQCCLPPVLPPTR